ncbi:hypothetical protein EDD21DRAFT_411474 [Dissophora ornata]|nr:hypothetical protein BGZ58_000491 [Dissophora ornata]KAI8605072.1 hypothetical protein EDD21DRAFT_411474 [Dissophora ornata]
MLDGSISLGIIVKPEKKVTFTWSTIVNEATLDNFKSYLFDYYPQYAHDEYLEIFLYSGQPKPERFRSDEDLRKVLKIAKTTSKTKLTISLETPTKNFSAWTFKDVCTEYDLSLATDPGLDVIPRFTDIKAAPLNSDLEKKMLDQLINEVESMVHVLNLIGANEATKSMVVGAFLVKATRLFNEDLFLAAQRDLSGRRGNGPVDFSVHSRKGYDHTLGVTKVKKDDFRQGVAQNIVQLESALTEKKRKRGLNDVDGEGEQLTETRSYGIVTDASMWLLIECTLHEDERVSYRMTELGRTLNYSGNWKDDAKYIFERLVWLWSLMRDEIPARESYARKLTSAPSNKKVSM